MKKTWFSVVVLILSSVVASRSQDADGCKDNALFTRLPDFVIESCTSNYNATEFQLGSSKVQSIEGNVTMLKYAFGSETGKRPSPLQIIKNYENAVLKNKGKKVYSGADELGGGEMAATFTMTIKDKEYWIRISDMYTPETAGEIGAYSLFVLERSAMRQDIRANEMFETLNNTGSVALYINFETGKSDIKPESQAIIDQITQMLQANPSLKVSIEGHTDNVGNAAANKTLSETRARSVVKALTTAGIDGGRLVAKGWGQEKPVADNSSEEGKAKNRRVEIVKL
ncbi:MAG TPA: OmpA family protein [Chryseosolibacter sp.]|nr:OmpA family protein [Chryseosolibacter sp.]